MMSTEYDIAVAIHHEIISPGSVDAALDLWQHRQVGASDRADMWRVLALTSSAAIDAVLARRQREAARTGPWEGGHGTQPDPPHRYQPHKKYPWFCGECGYPEHERLKHERGEP